MGLEKRAVENQQPTHGKFVVAPDFAPDFMMNPCPSYIIDSIRFEKLRNTSSVRRAVHITWYLMELLTSVSIRSIEGHNGAHLARHELGSARLVTSGEPPRN